MQRRAAARKIEVAKDLAAEGIPRPRPCCASWRTSGRGRQVAQRCLYGVDRNPMATDLARLSLWLATLARDHEFTFLDHALKPGDSLVGLTRAQIGGLRWRDGQTDCRPVRRLPARTDGQAVQARADIRDAPDDMSGSAGARHRAVEGRSSRRGGSATRCCAFFFADKAAGTGSARAAAGGDAR